MGTYCEGGEREERVRSGGISNAFTLVQLRSTESELPFGFNLFLLLPLLPLSHVVFHALHLFQQLLLWVLQWRRYLVTACTAHQQCTSQSCTPDLWQGQMSQRAVALGMCLATYCRVHILLKREGVYCAGMQQESL